MKVNFDKPIIEKECVLETVTGDLDNFYAAASDIDRINLFFILLASLHYYEEKGDTVRTAHLSFMTAYYVFVPLTPPGSEYLALYYMNKAVSLNPIPEYKEWLSIMGKGN